MENESSDQMLESKNLEDGEIDSEEECETDEKQTKGNGGKMWALQCIRGGLLKHMDADTEEDDKSPNKVTQYFDHDQVQNEDNWTHNITFSAKKRKRCWDGVDGFKLKINPFKRKGSQLHSSEENPDEDFVSGNARFSNPSSAHGGGRNCKLGALLHIKARKSKKPKKRKSKSKKLTRENEDIYRTPCQFYMEGNCAKGDDCPFYHPPRQLRKKELCKFYSTGHCRKRKQCPFMHEEFPCKFFHTGSVCYSKENCRFSHKPLTEETKMLLDKHLRGPSSSKDGDDHGGNGNCHHERSKPDPNVKRACLLGSPPKHVRDAVETKQWQEEMKRLQQEHEYGFAFKIWVSPVKEVTPPNQFTRPSFYVDTLLLPPSPKKRSPLGEISDSVSPSKLHSVPKESPFTQLIAEGSDNGMTSDASAPEKKEKSLHGGSEDTDLVKESQLALSPAMVHRRYLHSSESGPSPTQDNEKVGSPRDRTAVPISESYLQPEITSSPGNTPSHRSFTEKIYFPCVQLNQEGIPTEKSAGSKVIPDTPEKAEFISAEIEVDGPSIKKCYYFYSSDDDDEDDDDDSEEDDSDQSLTDQLFDTPCPEDEDRLPPKSLFDIVQMKKVERQNISEKSQASAYHETKTYWENIMSSSAPSSASTSATTFVVCQDISRIQATLQSPESSRKSEISHDPRKETPELKTCIPYDLQLQNREQRIPVRDFYFPPPPFSFEEHSKAPPPLIHAEIGNRLPNRLGDTRSTLQSPTPAGEGSESQCFTHTHKVPVSSTNYLTPIHGSKYDPCLHKHLAQSSNAVPQVTLQSKGTALPNVMPFDSLYSDIYRPVSKQGDLSVKASDYLKFKDAKIPLQKDVDSPMCKISTADSRALSTDARTSRSDVVDSPVCKIDTSYGHVLPSVVHTSKSKVVPTSRPRRSVPYSGLCSLFSNPRFTSLLRPQNKVQRKVSAALPRKNISSTPVKENGKQFNQE